METVSNLFDLNIRPDKLGVLKLWKGTKVQNIYQSISGFQIIQNTFWYNDDWQQECFCVAEDFGN